jgi:hypothetical protein
MKNIIGWCLTATEPQELLGGKENAEQMLIGVSDPNIASNELSKIVHSCTVNEALRAIQSLLPEGHADRPKFVSIMEFACSKQFSQIQEDPEILKSPVQNLLKSKLQGDSQKWTKFLSAAEVWCTKERNCLKATNFVPVEDHNSLKKDHDNLQKDFDDLKKEFHDLKKDNEDLKKDNEDLKKDHEKEFHDLKKAIDLLRQTAGLKL